MFQGKYIVHTDEHMEGVEKGEDRKSPNFLWSVDCVTTSGMLFSSLFCIQIDQTRGFP